jgi:hypothetical protein
MSFYFFLTLGSSFISFDLLRVAECVELLSNLYYWEETKKNSQHYNLQTQPTYEMRVFGSGTFLAGPLCKGPISFGPAPKTWAFIKQSKKK